MPRTSNPDKWMVGPDPVKKKLHREFLVARCQATYRSESWNLSMAEFINMWLEDYQYLKKGRSLDSLCMTRIDKTGAWEMGNVHIITRREHFYNVGSMTNDKS